MQFFLDALAFGLVTSAVLALAGVGFTLQFGTAKFFNLTYGQVMTACAYIAWLINNSGVSIWIALPIAGVAGAVLSVLLNRALFAPFLRRGMTLYGLLIVTLAAGFLIQNGIVALGGITFFVYRMNPGSTFHVFRLPFTYTQVIIIGLALVAMLAVHILLAYTKLGRAIRATANDPSLARSCGINTSLILDASWLLSGALCGLAGVVLVVQVGTFQAATGSEFLPLVVAAAFVGGIGQPYGAMIGSLLIGLVTEVSGAYTNPSFKSIIALGLLVIFIWARPQGLVPSQTQVT